MLHTTGYWKKFSIKSCNTTLFLYRIQNKFIWNIQKNTISALRFIRWGWRSKNGEAEGIKTELTVCVKEVREIICLCVNVSVVDGGDTEATVTSYLRLS